MMKNFLEPKLEILLLNEGNMITASDPDDPENPIYTPLLPM